MPLLLIVILSAWLLFAAVALVLCLAARRTDEEIAGAELAPVIDIQAGSLASRQHVA
jgi:hypothetical protein